MRFIQRLSLLLSLCLAIQATTPRPAAAQQTLGYIPNRATWSQVLDALFFIDRAGPEVHHPR